jgi:hypothetical protein
MSRAVIVCILIVALIGSGLTRQWADNVRGEPVVAASNSGRSLSGMNSYALALLLGGLRGPLVMFLWSSSESQKSENNLEDFDSKVEWIRLLQPEFDTVHIFEIWNKAYNISVKMTTLGNKYAAILDALDYAHSVDAEKPNDINIVSAIGGIFLDKLGGATEKFYYRKRVRAETQPHATDMAIRRRDIAVRRTELDPILDDDFNILPELIKPRMDKPLVDPLNAANRYDGSELQFLPQFQPYLYGVSPLALAYNYDKRAQMLQMLGGQRHAQLSDLVIDSRPALAIRAWADEDCEYGRRAELHAFGHELQPDEDRMAFENTAAPIPLNTAIVDRKSIEEAIFQYDRAVALYQHADGEFVQHILRFRESEQLYESHRAEIHGLAALVEGDADYLKAMVAPPDQRAALVAAAVKSYSSAADLERVIILRYSVWQQVADQLYPTGVTKANVNEHTPQLAEITDKAVAAMEKAMGRETFLDDSGPYLQYIDRALTRVKLRQSAPSASAQ